MNFFDLLRASVFELIHLESTSSGPGVYCLFDENGDFIYVGKASDLKSVITRHCSPAEENSIIKKLAKYYVCRTTSTTAEAEKLEGEIYDSWEKVTGFPPIANRIKPPASSLQSRIEEALKLLRTKGIIKS